MVQSLVTHSISIQFTTRIIRVNFPYNLRYYQIIFDLQTYNIGTHNTHVSILFYVFLLVFLFFVCVCMCVVSGWVVVYQQPADFLLLHHHHHHHDPFLVCVCTYSKRDYILDSDNSSHISNIFQRFFVIICILLWNVPPSCHF